jgi:hypothetical protein
MRWNSLLTFLYVPRHEHQVHALYCDIDDRIIAGFEASTRYGFKALFTQIHPIDTSYAMNGGDVTYLQEGGGCHLTYS